MDALKAILNRLKRTLLAFLPMLARPDDDFARSVLLEQELGLYLGMDARDRCHSVQVAKRVLRHGSDTGRDLLAAALLHDVAKSQLPYRPFQRIIAHLYRPTGLPESPLRSGLAGYLQLREHHERIGAAMLREAGAPESVARLLEGLADERSADARVLRLRRADDAA